MEFLLEFVSDCARMLVPCWCTMLVVPSVVHLHEGTLVINIIIMSIIYKVIIVDPNNI